VISFNQENMCCAQGKMVLYLIDPKGEVRIKPSATGRQLLRHTAKSILNLPSEKHLALVFSDRLQELDATLEELGLRDGATYEVMGIEREKERERERERREGERERSQHVRPFSNKWSRLSFRFLADDPSRDCL